jgi:hypothetical protein
MLIAMFAPGELWIVNHSLQPVARASTTQAARAGFHGPYKLTAEERQAAADFEAKLEETDG